MDHSTPGLPVHDQLPEFTKIHVHRVGDTIQPPHPLLSPSAPALNLSQHQGLFKWVSSSHQLAKVLEFQLQHQSFQWTPRTDLLEDGLVGSPCGPRDSQESSLAPQFKSINSSALSFLYSPTLTSMTTGNTIALTRRTFVGKAMSLLFNMLSRLVLYPANCIIWELFSMRNKWCQALTNGFNYDHNTIISEGIGSLACCNPELQRIGHDLVTEQQQQTLS